MPKTFRGFPLLVAPTEEGDWWVVGTTRRFTDFCDALAAAADHVESVMFDLDNEQPD